RTTSRTSSVASTFHFLLCVAFGGECRCNFAGTEPLDGVGAGLGQDAAIQNHLDGRSHAQRRTMANTLPFRRLLWCLGCLLRLVQPSQAMWWAAFGATAQIGD